MPNTFLELEEQLLECDSEIKIAERIKDFKEHDISYLNSLRKLRYLLISKLIELGFTDWVVQYQLSLEVK